MQRENKGQPQRTHKNCNNVLEKKNEETKFSNRKQKHLPGFLLNMFCKNKRVCVYKMK